MAIKRVDKLRNVANVAKEILSDPLQTEREIAKKLGVDRSTVNRAKDEIHAITPNDAKLTDLVGDDIEIQKLAQKEMKRRLTETPGEVAGTDLKGWSEVTLKRAQLLTGQATERIDFIGDILKEIQ